ncbi:MAG: tetratricopeptide repeat protein, partial [Spirochaetales bacterium]
RAFDGLAVLAANRDFEAGRYHEAVAAYMEAGLDSFDGVTSYDLANAFMEMGEFTSAEPLFQAAKDSPEARVVASAWHNLGAALFDLDRFEEAAQAFRSSLEVLPGRLETIRAYELSLEAVKPTLSGGAVERSRAIIGGTGGEASFFSLSRKADRATFVSGSVTAYRGVDH